jgi:hypothetical protein
LVELLQYCSDVDTGTPPITVEGSDVETKTLLMYVPEFYLSTFIEVFHALRRGPLPPDFFTGKFIS